MSAAALPRIGVVVTHGTLERTAHFLKLVLKVAVPVGAMRPSSALGRDEPAERHPRRGRGMGVLNDEINAARDVAKTSNYRRDIFVSRDAGVLGSTDGDGVAFCRWPLLRPAGIIFI